MPPKPNYNMQRADRDRAKQAKKDEKKRDKEEAARKKSEEVDGATPPADPEA